ncbi:hypothetical protein, partial [Salmonella enterica]|uniref:hypothetical protein n=1 Tax=Salmonella enterica TaxID=28901 RepID=UPI0021B3264A
MRRQDVDAVIGLDELPFERHVLPVSAGFVQVHAVHAGHYSAHAPPGLGQDGRVGLRVVPIAVSHVDIAVPVGVSRQL